MPSPPSRTAKQRILGLSILTLLLVVPGLLLGLAKGGLGDDGELGRGLELGWKYAIAFFVSIVIVLVVRHFLLKLRTPEIACFILMMFLFRLLMRTATWLVEGRGEFTLSAVGEDLLFGVVVGAGTMYGMRLAIKWQSAKQDTSIEQP